MSPGLSFLFVVSGAFVQQDKKADFIFHYDARFLNLAPDLTLFSDLAPDLLHV